jgi:hypothetical protein
MRPDVARVLDAVRSERDVVYAIVIGGLSPPERLAPGARRPPAC